MSKTVWFVSRYSMPPELERRVKTLKYAEYFNEMGYKTKIFTASTLHDYNDNLIKDNTKYIQKNYNGLEFVHIKCITYKNNYFLRIINLFQFSRRFAKYAADFELPDYIVATDISCIDYKPICRFCKKHGIKLIADIRDLWPKSIVVYLGFSEKNPIIRTLYKREKDMYKKCDAVIFSVEGGKDYIKDQGWSGEISNDKVFYINNGVDIRGFEYDSKNHILEDDDLKDTDTFKVVYTGSVRKVNNLEIFTHVAKELKEYKNIKILIYGDGDEKEPLEKLCEENNLDNIIFKGGVDKKYIPYILSRANLNIVHVKKTPLEKYGASWNKIFEYFASGKPILSDTKVNYDPIVKYNAGIVLDAQDAKLISQKIIDFYKMDKKEYDKYCENSKLAANEFDYRVLANKLKDIILLLDK